MARPASPLLVSEQRPKPSKSLYLNGIRVRLLFSSNETGMRLVLEAYDRPVTRLLPPAWAMPAKPPRLVPVTDSQPSIPALAPSTLAQEPRRTFCFDGEPMTGQPRADSDTPHAPKTKPPAAPLFAKRSTRDRPAPPTETSPLHPVDEKKGNETNPKTDRTDPPVRSTAADEPNSNPPQTPKKPERSHPPGWAHGFANERPSALMEDCSEK